MRNLKIWLATVVIVVLSLSLAGCAGSSGAATPTAQLTAVKNGNILISVTATGNLALSTREDLAFPTAGTVAEILVEEGESVEKGKVLATLDDTQLKEQIKALEDKVNTAKRTVTTRERALAKAERAVPSAELSLRQAQMSLETAEYNLTQIAEAKDAQVKIDSAAQQVRTTEAMYENAWITGASAGEMDYWKSRINSAKAALAEAEQELKDILSGTGTNVTADLVRELQSRNLQIDQAKLKLEDAHVAVEDAKAAVEDARRDLDDARQAVKEAEEDLGEASQTSLQVTAPYSGFISKINTSGGVEVKKGTIAMQIADPTKFEVVVLVSERDISSIKVGGEATVLVDALTLNLPAKITRIAPTATITQGVVNYSVTVEISSLQPARTELSGQTGTTRQGAFSANPEELESQLNQAVEQGRMTREQADQFISRIKSGQGLPAQGSLPAQVAQPAATPQAAAALVKQGQSVTITIPVLQKNEVLLVPNRAISRQGRDTVVQVMKDGVTETRIISTGVSDLTNTEVTSGLTEGEQVVLPQAAASSSTSQNTGGQQGNMFRMAPGSFVR